MIQIDATECPDKVTLTDYLLGQLEAPRLDECESHIADCNKCHETLRGLSADDTLTQHVGDAFLHVADSNSVSVAASESQHVRGLVDRLLSETNSHPRQPTPTHADTEILADRAAEVLRCVESDPSQQTLGSIGNYQLIRLLGAGSTGVVFQAIDEKLDRPVALKVLRPSLGSVARERFIAEARLAASIEHPNVVTIYQIDQQDRLAYIAMQWLPGQTLETKLQTVATMVDEDVRRIAAQVAAGLQAAHQRQLVHRDIKPANIWISNKDEVKILDFGLARIVDDDPGLTATGMLAGTPNFMSPEQTKGHGLDGRSDLFSLGCMMYRMATGKFAFGASSILGTLQAIQHEQPTSPKLVNAAISSDLSDLTMSLLEKQAANRPESAAQVVTMLETERHQWPMRIAGYESVQPEAQKDSSVWPQPSRQGFAGGWGAAIAASLLALAGWYFSPQIIRIATDRGELVIESTDKDVEVQILKDGKVFRVLDTKTKNSFNIESGEYQIKATGEGNSFEVTPESLTMKRGEKQIVSVTRQRIKPSVTDIRYAELEQLAKLERLVDGMRQKSLAEFELEKTALLTQFGTGHPKILKVEKKIEALKRRPKSTNNRQVAVSEEVDDGVVPDVPMIRAYRATTNLSVAFNTLLAKLENRDGVKLRIEADRGLILVTGRKDDHQLVSETLATLSSPPEASSDGLLGSVRSTDKEHVGLSPKPAVSNRPKYKGKPFAHWINITKTERSTEMLCDALQAGAALAVTAEEKTMLLEVVRTLARRHGAPYLALTRGNTDKLDSENELVRYYEALVKAINMLDPAEIIQFVLDELKKGTPQSVGFCSCIINDRSRSNKSVRIIWKEAHNNAFVERAPELLKLVVAQIEEGGSRAGNRGALLHHIISTLIETSNSKVNFVGGGKRAYVSGVHEKRVARAMEKNPTLAPTIRQLFLESSPVIQLTLIRLTRAFWPNDEEVELAIQSNLFDPSVFEAYPHGFFGFIVGGKRQTYWDFLSSSSKPIAVQALKKLLDNQLGPEDQRIAAFDSNDEIEGRPATLLYIVESLATLLNKHPNDTDEDVVPAINGLLKRIVAIEETGDPSLRRELDDFKALRVFRNSKKLLVEEMGQKLSRKYIYIDSNSPVFGRLEKGDKVDVSRVKRGSAGKFGSPEPLHIGLEVSEVVDDVKDRAAIALKGLPNLLTLDASREKLLVEFHDVQRALLHDELKLNGVWRQVPIKKDGAVRIPMEAPPLQFLKNHFVTAFFDETRCRLFSIVQKADVRFLRMDNGLLPSWEGSIAPYRFLENGKLEIDSDWSDGKNFYSEEKLAIPEFKNVIRFERVTAPVSKAEKWAFEVRTLTEKAQHKTKLEFFIAEDVGAEKPNNVPEGSELVRYDGMNLLVGSEPVISSQHVAQARYKNGAEGPPELGVTLTAEGAWRMGAATKSNIGKIMVAKLNDKIILAPKIIARVTREIAITGDNKEEFVQMSEALNSIIKFPAGTKLDPAVTSVQLPADPLTYLHKIVLALQAYEADYGRFPPAKIKLNDNDPPHSWRVAILPYLGHVELYAQYRFDETWGSEANKKVLAKMPYVYRAPWHPSGATFTNCLGIVGKNGGFGPQKGRKLAEFKDGTSSTALLIESKAAFPWTKPEDFYIDPIEEMGRSGNTRVLKEGSLAGPALGLAFADGSTAYLDTNKLATAPSKDSAEDDLPALLKLLLIDDGFPIDIEPFKVLKTESIPGKQP